jgi:hypothetical protein
LYDLVVSVDVHEDVVLAEVSLEPIKNSAGDGNGVFLAVGDENPGHKATSLCDIGGARQCVKFTVKKAALRLVRMTFSKIASSVEPVGSDRRCRH